MSDKARAVQVSAASRARALRAVLASKAVRVMPMTAAQRAAMTTPNDLPVYVGLPRLIGNREIARRMVADLGDIRGRRVIIDTRDLRSAAPSFVKELVGAIRAGEPESLQVCPAHPDFPGIPVLVGSHERPLIPRFAQSPLFADE